MPQKFPPDEFDGITDSERRGTHREKSARLGGVSSIVFVAIVAVVVVLLAVSVVNVVNSGKSGSHQETAISGNNKNGSNGSDGKSGKNGRTTKSPKNKKSESSSPAATADKSQQIQVLNSTTTAGMAARASEKLSGDGWTVSGTGNVQSPSTTTTVYYTSKDLKATAEAVAKALGTTAVKQSTQYTGKVTVVLASDYSDS